jgi:hypothetical protein
VYRRWGSLGELLAAVAASKFSGDLVVPDTGTLRGDLRQYLYNGRDALAHPLVRSIVPDMLAEAIRSPELADVLARTVREPRRIKAAELFERAMARGELPPDTNLDLSMDLLAGPVYWRLAVMQLPVDDAYCDRLADSVVAAVVNG